MQTAAAIKHRERRMSFNTWHVFASARREGSRKLRAAATAGGGSGLVDVRLITYTSQPSCTSARSASASFSCLKLAIARRAGGSVAVRPGEDLRDSTREPATNTGEPELGVEVAFSNHDSRNKLTKSLSPCVRAAMLPHAPRAQLRGGASTSAWRSRPVGAERVLATSLVPAYLPMGAEYLLSARSDRSSSYL